MDLFYFSFYLIKPDLLCKYLVNLIKMSVNVILVNKFYFVINMISKSYQFEFSISYLFIQKKL